MKKLPLSIDLVFCLIVLPVMAVVFPVERWFHHFPVFMISAGVWLYLAYFINRFLAVPLLFRKGSRKWIGLGLVVGSVVVTSLLSEVRLYEPKPNIHDADIAGILPKTLQYQQALWSLYMIVEAFSSAVGLLTQTNRQRARMREAEAKRDRAEIQLYKAQIKPHFMFNTLNSLYGLFLTKDEKALTSLEKFIAMMRYMHTTSNKDMVALSEEVDYIREYVEVQSLRLNDKTAVSLDISVADGELLIPPMLLVTFVENCFKHGVSPVEPSRIEIVISESGGMLEFSTSNRIFPKRKIGEHIGIENCRRRLDLLYPRRHRIEISANDGAFRVDLKICLTRVH